MKLHDHLDDIIQSDESLHQVNMFGNHCQFDAALGSQGDKAQIVTSQVGEGQGQPTSSTSTSSNDEPVSTPVNKGTSSSGTSEHDVSTSDIGNNYPECLIDHCNNYLAFILCMNVVSRMHV